MLTAHLARSSGADEALEVGGHLLGELISVVVILRDPIEDLQHGRKGVRAQGTRSRISSASSHSQYSVLYPDFLNVVLC